MRRLPILARLLAGIAAMATVAAAASIDAAARTEADAALKAAFVHNFVKFTEWPEDVLAPGDTIVVCVGNPEVATALERAVAGQRINDHGLRVRRVTTGDPADGCAAAYLSGVDARLLPGVLTAFARTGTLTVSDDPRFAERGGIVGLFVEDGRIRFAVNVSAAARSRLRLSSQLLGLARIVRD